MATYTVSDVHGAYKAFKQVLEKSSFNKEEDTLIFIGDAADGWSEVPELIEELLSIKNLINIKGNHDDWCYQWLKYGVKNPLWLQQGGEATYEAYTFHHPDLMLKHEKEFFAKQIYYYIDDKNRLFVHGGFNWKAPFKETEKSDLIWDRKMYQAALFWQFQHDERDQELIRIKEFDEVFIGHSTTLWSPGKFNNYLPTDKPLHVSNVWNIDNGCGYGGRCTLMNVDTKEYWQSDPVKELYPNEKGR